MHLRAHVRHEGALRHVGQAQPVRRETVSPELLGVVPLVQQHAHVVGNLLRRPLGDAVRAAAAGEKDDDRLRADLHAGRRARERFEDLAPLAEDHAPDVSQLVRKLVVAVDAPRLDELPDGLRPALERIEDVRATVDQRRASHGRERCLLGLPDLVGEGRSREHLAAVLLKENLHRQQRTASHALLELREVAEPRLLGLVVGVHHLREKLGRVRRERAREHEDVRVRRARRDRDLLHLVPHSQEKRGVTRLYVRIRCCRHRTLPHVEHVIGARRVRRATAARRECRDRYRVERHDVRHSGGRRDRRRRACRCCRRRRLRRRLVLSHQLHCVADQIGRREALDLVVRHVLLHR